ncbi:MAG: hypothetical protein HQP61_02330 [Peptococcaceae bacterium]|nr:hypothetical protein [Candidatus Syntrophopropionicum ammoniitolerans]
MIEQVSGGDRYLLFCDSCGEIEDRGFKTVQEVVIYKKAAGWKSKLRYCSDLVRWEEHCPDCQSRRRRYREEP